MIKLTTAALFFLLVGIFTSVSILSVYQALIAIPVIFYSYKAIKEKSFKLPTSGWILIAFTCVALISLFVNYDLLPKPSKNFGRMKYLLYGIGGILVLRVFIQEATDKTKRFLANTFLLSVAAAGIYASFTFFKNGDRARGFTDTLRYGYGSSMMLLFLLSAILHRERLKHLFNPQIAVFAFVCGLLGMYLTYNRGSLLAFLCGLPFVLYYYRPKLGLTLGGLAVLGVLGLVGIYLFGSGNYNSRFLVNKNNPSDHIRRSQWKAGIIAVQERPVLGWGYSNFHSQLKRIKDHYDLDAKSYNDAHSHNLFLEIAAGTGLFGVLIFISWVLTWAWEVFRAGGIIRALVIPFGVAFVVGSQFEVTFDSNNASMIFFLYSLSSCFTLDSYKQV